jgi:phosphoglycolate phosphatase
MKKLILFDFDGVLVDTLSICFSLNAENNDALSLEEYKSFFKGNVYEAKRFDGSSMKYRDDYFEKYATQTRELKVPEEIIRILKELSAKYILAIVSSAPKVQINDILNREKVSYCFVDIFGSDFHTSKVIKIKMILEKFGVTNTNVIFITDTMGDIIEARECGVKSIAVSWGFHDPKDLLQEKPFALVYTPQELEQKIKEFFK